MTKFFAQLEIIGYVGTKQKVLLDRDVVRIGRASDNNLILSESNVSRHHAQIVWEDKGYFITDLSNTDGTRVNNAKLLTGTPWLLANGDLILIGTSELRFSTEAITTQFPQLEKTVASTKPLPLPETSVLAERSAPVLRVVTPQWTQDFPLERDLLVLGRDPQSDIVINLSDVSARHAQLKRCNDSYEIIDLNSKNGLIYEGRRIAQQLLADSDVLHIGSVVTLTYQGAALPEIIALKQHLDLRDRTTLSLGRDPQNDTVIDHPVVSRYHALIAKQDGSFYIVDLNSRNGTFVNGKQIHNKRSLMAGDSIRIGPCRLILSINETLVRNDEEGNLWLDAINLTKVVGQEKILLNDISLSIRPKEFVVIAGVSGGGKTTLLDALNGFRPATRGEVLVNGVDLYKNFNAYRTELGYVPQKDIVHQELSVWQALDYAARLRMPEDTTPAERHRRLQEVLEDLELTKHREIPIKSLSTGHRKRGTEIMLPWLDWVGNQRNSP